MGVQLRPSTNVCYGRARLGPKVEEVRGVWREWQDELGVWRERQDEELDNLYLSPNTY